MPDPAHITAQIAAIRQRVRDYWRDEQACAEASQAWGGGYNEHGVFLNGQDEVVARCKNAEAIVTTAESLNGLFAYGLHFQGAMSGFGFAPSIWREAYGSRAEAMQAGLEEMLDHFEHDVPGSKAAAAEISSIRQQVLRRLQPQQADLFGVGFDRFTRPLTTGSDAANLPPINSMEASMAEEPEAEKAPEAAAPVTAEVDALDAAITKLKERKPRAPRKPRTPRNKKVETMVETVTGSPVEHLPVHVAPPAADPAKPEAVLVVTVPEQQTQAAEPVQAEPSAEPHHANGHVNGHVTALHREPKIRRDGRIPLDINLGGHEHVWERLISADREQIDFRFKSMPTEAQMDLIQRNGFAYDHERKEASRPNDATGRMYADKLAWYLKQLERSQQAAVSV